MKRLIYADELKSDILSKMYLAQKEYLHKSHIIHQIDIAPTVDAVEVVHGRWEDEYGGKYANPRYRCSVCKEKALYKMEQDELLSWHEVQALTDYCPNCGAKMDGD